MYSTLKRLYGFNMMSKEEIAEATYYEWITPEQYKDITGDDYAPTPDKPNNVKINTKVNSAIITSE